MKKNLGIFTGLLMLCQIISAQAVNDYRSVQSGNWDAVSTWERYDGTDWVAAVNFPTRVDGVITITNGHSVNIIEDVLADEIVVESGADLNVTSATLSADIDPGSPSSAAGIDVYGTLYLTDAILHTDRRKIQVFGKINFINSTLNVAGAIGLEPAIEIKHGASCDMDDELSAINALTAVANHGTINRRGGFIGPVLDNYGYVLDVANTTADTINNYSVYEKGGFSNTTLHATVFSNTGVVWISHQTSIIVETGFGPGAIQAFINNSATIKGNQLPATPLRIDMRLSPSNYGQPAQHGHIIFDGGLNLAVGVDSLIVKDVYNIPNGSYEMITTINGSIQGDFDYLDLPDGYTLENTGTSIILHRFIPTNHFRSKQSGDWRDLQTWEMLKDGNWINADHIPFERDSTITIRNTHIVSIDTSIYIDDLTVDIGAVFNIFNCELETNYTGDNGDSVAIRIYGTVNLSNSLLDITSDNKVLVFGTINFDNSYLYQSFYAPTPDFVVEATGTCNLYNSPVVGERLVNYGTVNRAGGGIVNFYNYGTLIDSGNTQVYSNMINTGIYRIAGAEHEAHFNIFQNQGGIITGSGTLYINNNISGGTVLPGDSTGILKVISGIPSTIDKLVIELNNASGPGTGHDQLLIEGGLDQTISDMDTLEILETASVPNGSYTIVKLQNNGDNHITGSFETVLLPAGYSIMYHADSIVVTKFTGPVPNMTISNVSITEGNTGIKQFKFVARLNIVPASTVQVSYTTVDSTAEAGVDYTATSGTLNFAPGQRTDTIRVAVNGDKLVEGNEYFSVQLSNAVNANIIQSTGTGTIRNDDTYPVLIASNRAIAEGDLADTTVLVQVRLNKPYPDTVSFNYTTSDSTAIAGTDYLPANGMIVFVPGDTLGFIPVTIKGDRINEPNDIFFINPSNPVNCTIGAAVRNRVTINNDDALPRIIFNSITVNEGNNDQWNSTAFTVRLNRAYPLPVTVRYHTVDSTATEGQDYQSAAGVITFAPEDTLETISISILGDRFVENDEHIRVILDSVSNAIINNSTTNIRLNNDDNYPNIVLSPVSVTEADAGTVQSVFTVRLNRKYPGTVTVNYVTQNGSAIAGTDYIYDSSQLIFAPDDSVETISVTVLPDLVDELNENFTVKFSNAVNAVITGVGTATGTIVDNDPVPALVINDTTVNEADNQAVLTLRLSTQSGKQVRVIYRTQEGTAKDTLDYEQAVSDTVYFEPGEMMKTIAVAVYQDIENEANENFTVLLQSVTNATTAVAQGGDNRGVVTIMNSAPMMTRSVNTPVMETGRKASLKNDQSTLIIPTLVKRGTAWKILNMRDAGHEVVLFNVSGQVVMKTSVVQNGVVLNFMPGIYMYILNVNNGEGKKQRYTGRILIIE